MCIQRLRVERATLERERLKLVGRVFLLEQGLEGNDPSRGVELA